MGRFLDALANRKYNLAEEIHAIEDLSHRRHLGDSIFSYFSYNFLSWHRRNNYVDVNVFLHSTGLNRIIHLSNKGLLVSLDEYLYYSEYILNIVEFVQHSYPNHPMIDPIRNNIMNVLEQINYTVHCDENDDVHIVENDVLISESAEVVGNTYDLGEKIYAYNYRDLAGDLNAKADILCRLYKYYETIETKAKSYGFANLADDISALSNKLDVRHAPTQKQEIVLGTMTKAEIEEWYDELFRLYLSLIILVDYKEKRRDIKDLKSQLG